LELFAILGLVSHQHFELSVVEDAAVVVVESVEAVCVFGVFWERVRNILL
jgi:hypothetical protein